ncbi:MAG TPA: DNA polymerase III subunit gamma/tau [Verrucomicrobiae bacterium]|nr:DNA polymerase III subunit gamma/tau [Verrucomicrobiae bacterium]
MGRALYRKYRSKKLSEIVGQEHVTTALSNALKNNTISHAYLFTGPRGVGKTSIARILAHEVNNLPYDEDTTHLDIIEIDAASNRRIDEIRTLRERVHNAPTSAKYKVYIIDEVHMLTKEAFNALLKTLEEPPAHVIFILATTEAHKLPETIISRTQRYTFKPADPEDAAKHLKEIATKEGITISNDALDLVAKHGNGSFRDSISLLDQVSNTADKIELTDAQRALGIAPTEAIQQLVAVATSGDSQQVVQRLQSLYDQGFQPAQVAKQLSGELRTQAITAGASLPADKALDIVRKLLDVPGSHDPAALLEIIVLGVALSQQGTQSSGVRILPPQPKNKPAEPVQTPEPKAEPASPPAVVQPGPPVEEASQPEPEKTPTPASALPTTTLDEATWQQVLQTIKQKNNTLYGITRMATPIFNDGELILSFEFPFHQKRVNDVKNKQIISDSITEVTGMQAGINCIVDKKTSTPPQPTSRPEIALDESPQPASPLDTISNIFGGGEVLE